MEYKYTGIVIGKRDVGETDRIYSMYTLESGKIQALAKGVRKPQAKLAGSLENFTLADITVMRTRGMGKITSSIVEKNHVFLKKNYEALMNSLQSMQVFNRLVDLEHCDKKIFLLLEEFLEQLNLIARNQKKAEEAFESCLLLRLGFSFKLLNELGYSLIVSECVNCGQELFPSNLHFNASQGGIICQNCFTQAQNSIRINSSVVKLLRLFLQNDLNKLLKVKVSSADLRLTQGVLQNFLNWL